MTITLKTVMIQRRSMKRNTKTMIWLMIFGIVIFQTFRFLYLVTRNGHVRESVVSQLSVSSLEKKTRVVMEPEPFVRKATLVQHEQDQGWDAKLYHNVKTFYYPNFTMVEPLFITKEDRQIFYSDDSNIAMLGVPSAEKLVGRIYEVKNGTFQHPFDCGYRSDVDYVLEKRKVSESNWYSLLMPLIIPDGWSFQHFLDGALPKLVQAMDYVRNPEVKILLEREPRDKIIWEMLAKLNVSRDRIVMQNKLHGADNLIFTCNTPPLHPLLWRKMRHLMGSYDFLPVSMEEAHVLVVTRKGCSNCGRTVQNNGEMMNLLYQKFGKENIKLFESPFHINTTTELFGKAKLIIGPHGGGLANIVFGTSNATVIELMPVRIQNGFPEYFVGPHKILWMESILMGQRFWRFYTNPVSEKGDMLVNITRLSDLLNKAF